MSKKKVERKSTIKPFVKFVNYNHLLATRFIVKDDFDFKSIVTDEAMEDPEQRKDAKKQLKAKLQERYQTPQGGEGQQIADFLFTKLRF